METLKALLKGNTLALRPDSAAVYLKQIQGELTAVQAELKRVLDTDLADFNKSVREQDIPPVAAVEKKKEGG